MNLIQNENWRSWTQTYAIAWDANATFHFFANIFQWTELHNWKLCEIVIDSAMYAFRFQHRMCMRCAYVNYSTGHMFKCSFSFKCVDYYQTMAQWDSRASLKKTETDKTRGGGDHWIVINQPEDIPYWMKWKTIMQMCFAHSRNSRNSRIYALSTRKYK